MGKKLSPEQNELYKRTDEILHYIWDPIGVSDSPYARDEYWGYLPRVFGMLIKNESQESIVNYLLAVESGQMGLSQKKKMQNVPLRFLRNTKKRFLARAPNKSFKFARKVRELLYSVVTHHTTKDDDIEWAKWSGYLKTVRQRS